MENQVFSCFHCNYLSTKKFNLRRHVSAWHLSSKGNIVRVTQFRCALCGLLSNKRGDVYSHYTNIHHIDIRPPERHSFSDWGKFLLWKVAIERQEACDFIRFNTTKTKEATTYYYRCYRDGHYRPKGKGVRKLKIKGSVKINGCCPASVTVRKSVDGKIQVKFVSTHVGHLQEFDRLRHPAKERNSVTRKIEAYVSPTNIPSSIVGPVAHKIESNVPPDCIADSHSGPKPKNELEKKKAMALSMFEEAFLICSEPLHFQFLIDRLKPAKSTIESLTRFSHLRDHDYSKKVNTNKSAPLQNWNTDSDVLKDLGQLPSLATSVDESLG